MLATPPPKAPSQEEESDAIGDHAIASQQEGGSAAIGDHAFASRPATGDVETPVLTNDHVFLRLGIKGFKEEVYVFDSEDDKLVGGKTGVKRGGLCKSGGGGRESRITRACRRRPVKTNT